MLCFRVDTLLHHFTLPRTYLQVNGVRLSSIEHTLMGCVASLDGSTAGGGNVE